MQAQHTASLFFKCSKIVLKQQLHTVFNLFSLRPSLVLLLTECTKNNTNAKKEIRSLSAWDFFFPFVTSLSVTHYLHDYLQRSPVIYFWPEYTLKCTADMHVVLFFGCLHITTFW